MLELQLGVRNLGHQLVTGERMRQILNFVFLRFLQRCQGSQTFRSQGKTVAEDLLMTHQLLTGDLVLRVYQTLTGELRTLSLRLVIGLLGHRRQGILQEEVRHAVTFLETRAVLTMFDDVCPRAQIVQVGTKMGVSRMLEVG
jgi:hypothetical protein